MAPQYSIEVEGLGKAFRAYKRPLDRVVESLTLGRWKRHREFWALKDVDFKLKPGSSLGLVGANGAGKSTLLKVLAGITPPTQGHYRINGSVASLLELGAGFHLDFTGRMNIVSNGVMMGFSRREMDRRMDEIIEFAELGEYIDQPVRTYSSGMGLRLAFAIACAVDPDVLIVDEVFAVGDMYFQKKCVDKIYSFKQRGKTILFCSHSLYDIRQLCDDAIWMRDGIPAAIGDSVFVTNEYTAFQREHIADAKGDITAEVPMVKRSGVDPALMPRIVDARLFRLGTDEECYQFTTGDDLELRVWWRNPEPDKTPVSVGTAFFRQDMTITAGMGTHFSNFPLKEREGCLVLRIPDIQMLSGQYVVPVILFDEGGVHRYEEFALSDNVVVRTETREVGMFRMQHEWEVVQRPTPSPRPTEKS
jgi:teichoic acid transport system ATP-binding protein